LPSGPSSQLESAIFNRKRIGTAGASSPPD
jgi:hypothetical protein